MNKEAVAFLHICKKQKGKAEKQDIEKALNTAKKEGLLQRSGTILVKSNPVKEQKIIAELTASDEALMRQHKLFQAEMQFKQELINKRKAYSLTQKDISERSGLSQQAISRLEKGNGGTIETIIKYLSAMGCSLTLKEI